MYGFVGVFLVAPLLAFALGYLFFRLPDPDEALNNQIATVSFADGNELTKIVPEAGNRIKVSYQQVPEHVRMAVLAAEDRTFHSNPGFDLTAILRAAWNQITGTGGGGSTITQQFVKNALVGDQQSLWRKYKEMVLAVKISQEKSKDEILTEYLNAIYFGRGAYGVESASRAYFGKGIDELSVSEGALLAGLIQSPSRWDPAVSPERAVQRWNFVVDGMVSQGWLNPHERAKLHFPFTVPRRPSGAGAPTDNRAHILNAIKDELADLGIGEQLISQAGLRIGTTIDPVAQQNAVDAARRRLVGQPANLRNSVVAIDPETGGVHAYYGGDNGVGLDYARVRKQAGSTFKPFVLLAALQRDPPIGLGATFTGREMPDLRNDDGADCDVCTLKQAMTISNNVVFYNLARQLGPQAVADAAHQAGVRSPLDNPNAGIALGNKEVTPFELASAYATLASGGVYRQPHLVSKVVTADGRVLFEAETKEERRIPAQVARNVTEAMLDVARHDGLQLPGSQQVAAKTGTVQSRFDGENNDAWMAGYTPSIAAVVWIGTDQNSPIRTASGTPISGGGLPASIWRTFLDGTTRVLPARSFPSFRPVGTPPEPSRPPQTAPAPSGPALVAPPSGGPVPAEGGAPPGGAPPPGDAPPPAGEPGPEVPAEERVG